MIVTIPSCANHNGVGLITLEISDNCPVCGGPRGKIYGGHSFDGSRRLNCDCWDNPCGHIDLYSDIRNEGKPVVYKEPQAFGQIQAVQHDELERYNKLYEELRVISIQYYRHPEGGHDEMTEIRKRCLAEVCQDFDHGEITTAHYSHAMRGLEFNVENFRRVMTKYKSKKTAKQNFQATIDTFNAAMKAQNKTEAIQVLRTQDETICKGACCVAENAYEMAQRLGPYESLCLIQTADALLYQCALTLIAYKMQSA